METFPYSFDTNGAAQMIIAIIFRFVFHPICVDQYLTDENEDQALSSREKCRNAAGW